MRGTKNKSIYAILSGILGLVFFSVAQYMGDHIEVLTSAQTTGIYIFGGSGLLLFIVSIVLGVQGYRNREGSKTLGCLGAIFTPILILLIIGFFLLIGWAAFIR